tara:strand:- start:3733 stop:3936 length:204 start_codon:yes stop_codon:yes gene_type:complete
MGTKPKNRYIVEIAIPTIEIYEVVSDIPLTTSEIVSRTQFRKPKEVKYEEALPTILVIHGKLEEEND